MSELYVFIYIYPLPLGSPSHRPTPSHPSRSSQSTKLTKVPVFYNRFPLALCFTHSSIHVSILISQFGPPSPSRRVHMSVLYVSAFIPALEIGLPMPCSRFCIYALMYRICFSLCDLLHTLYDSL